MSDVSRTSASSTSSNVRSSPTAEEFLTEASFALGSFARSGQPIETLANPHDLASARQLRQHLLCVESPAYQHFLGYADGLNLGDPRLGTPSPAPPGSYGDNTGTLNVSYLLTCP
jgi:hypothetical protein